MAMTRCPECGSNVSETADTCPNCGYSFKRKKASRFASLKTGAIVNIIGGIGYALMVAALFFISKTPEESDADITVTASVEPNGENASLLFLLSLVFLIAVTVISIVILCTKQPQRKQMLTLCGVQLGAAVLGFVFDIAVWNVAIVCCGMWVVMWGTLLQFIGSIMCLRGALKLDA